MVLKHTLFATILLALLSIPASIHAEDLKGRVLDANTKEPIEKASVKIEIKSGNSTQIMDIPPMQKENSPVQAVLRGV